MREPMEEMWLLYGKVRTLQRITTKMLTFQLSLLCLLKLGQTEVTFTFYRGKSLKETSHTFEITVEPISPHHHHHCAMRCYFEPPCLAAFFEGESSLCRLYSNINGTTTRGEGDFAIIKKDFGVSFVPYGSSKGSNPFSDKEYFIQHGYITAVKSWTNSPYYLSGIQFRYGSAWGPERGFTGNVAPQNEVFFDSGTFIYGITLWSGHILDVVTFYSETGNDLGTHGSSPLPGRRIINGSKLMYIEGKLGTYENVPTFTKVSFHFHGQ